MGLLLPLVSLYHSITSFDLFSIISNKHITVDFTSGLAFCKQSIIKTVIEHTDSVVDMQPGAYKLPKAAKEHETLVS